MRITKRFAVAVIIVFLGASISACTTGRAARPRESSPTNPSSPSSIAGNEALPTNVQPGSTSLPRHIQRIDDTHNRIYLSSDKKQCSMPYASTVQETTTSVTITVHGARYEKPGALHPRHGDVSRLCEAHKSTRREKHLARHDQFSLVSLGVRSLAFDLSF
jgi:hypothetical protein